MQDRNPLWPDALLRRMRIWRRVPIWRRNLVFWVGAIGVGIVAVLFAQLADWAYAAFRHLTAGRIWLSLLITPIGFALVVAVARRLAPATQGSGIPQVLAALHLKSSPARAGLLGLRVAFAKMALTSAALFSGASVGREGPTVQIGAAIMHALGRFSYLPHKQMERGLIIGGGAAGLAAAFNTPLAGIIFAIEEMSRSFEQRTSGVVLAAVIIAGLSAISLAGNYSYFGQSTATLMNPADWIAVPFCGLLGGLAGGLFSRMLIGAAHGIPGRAGVWTRRYPVRFAALCGLVLTGLNLASPENLFGTGYDEARAILAGDNPDVASFGLFKFAATVISYISGAPGGIFSPSLAIGAGLGLNLSTLLPWVPAGAVILLGMVAFFAGVVQAPITAFVIVLEMTGRHSMLFPLMATSLLAYGTARVVCPQPLYKSLAQIIIRKEAGKLETPARSPLRPEERTVE